MLPNGEFNVNSRYAAQCPHRDTPQILNPSQSRRNTRLNADVDAHRRGGLVGEGFCCVLPHDLRKCDVAGAVPMCRHSP